MVAMARLLLHVCVVYIHTYVWVYVLTVRGNYLYPCHQGKSLAVVANGAASLCYVGVCMYLC